MRLRQIFFGVVLVLGACATSSVQDTASRVEQAFTLADTAWVVYLRAPDCTTGTKVLFCRKQAVVDKGVPLEQGAWDKVETFYAAAYSDPLACDKISDTAKAECLTFAAAGVPSDKLAQAEQAAMLALSAFSDIVNALPKKGT